MPSGHYINLRVAAQRNLIENFIAAMFRYKALIYICLLNYCFMTNMLITSSHTKAMYKLYTDIKFKHYFFTCRFQKKIIGNRILSNKMSQYSRTRTVRSLPL